MGVGGDSLPGYQSILTSILSFVPLESEGKDTDGTKRTDMRGQVTWSIRGQIFLAPGPNSSPIFLVVFSSQGGFCHNYIEILRTLVSKSNLLRKPE